MSFHDSYCHRLKFDRPIRLATDNVVGYITQPEYNPVPPPVEGYFLWLDNTPFTLLDGENLTLL